MSKFSVFQSYLIAGPEEEAMRETEKLAQVFKINIHDKSSPDLFIISPQKAYISIDQIRDLKRHIFQKPVLSKFKFVIIKKAHKLTPEAQNALLKILEEPPRQAIIVLEAQDKHQLLPTIKSRVITKETTYTKTLTSKINILEEKNLVKSLEDVTQIENAEKWLDEQLVSLHNLLLETIQKDKNDKSSDKLVRAIQKCRETKEMIQANVNPKFALVNLIFSLHLGIIDKKQ